MLNSIEIENYRLFERYRLAGLSRVNLLVGKNNCGKTSVLEAAHLLASGGDPIVLDESARQRGEFTHSVEPDEGGGARALSHLAVSHFFHGHDLKGDARFCVRSNDGLEALTVSVLDIAGSAQELAHFRDAGPHPPAFSLRLEFGSRGAPTVRQDIPLTEEGTVSSVLLRRNRGAALRNRDGPAVPRFITAESLQPLAMHEMWDKAIVDGREFEVIKAMGILEPGLTGVFFLTGKAGFRFGGRSGIFVGLAGEKRRHPLGTYGEGMRRLLALSLSLIEAGGGVLLIDEIDTGLHYSIMGDMWRLVVTAAGQADVQVFATTHSSDCVRGLAWLCENHPELGAEASLQKIDPALEEAVALHADQITLAVDQGIEVR